MFLPWDGPANVTGMRRTQGGPVSRVFPGRERVVSISMLYRKQARTTWPGGGKLKFRRRRADGKDNAHDNLVT
jgi:hypothetical protein